MFCKVFKFVDYVASMHRLQQHLRFHRRLWQRLGAAGFCSQVLHVGLGGLVAWKKSSDVDCVACTAGGEGLRRWRRRQAVRPKTAACSQITTSIGIFRQSCRHACDCTRTCIPATVIAPGSAAPGEAGSPGILPRWTLPTASSPAGCRQACEGVITNML